MWNPYRSMPFNLFSLGGNMPGYGYIQQGASPIYSPMGTVGNLQRSPEPDNPYDSPSNPSFTGTGGFNMQSTENPMGLGLGKPMVHPYRAAIRRKLGLV